ncbi:MAG TPA: hypothetical protein VNA22_08440, partial [Pyrinomonadaceae bacterium]|nr:hypothetical protein [Pyrinomonadaceae bacterium]
ELRKPKTFGNKDLSGRELLKIAVDRLSDIEIGYFAVLQEELASLKDPVAKVEGGKIFSQ